MFFNLKSSVHRMMIKIISVVAVTSFAAVAMAMSNPSDEALSDNAEAVLGHDHSVTGSTKYHAGQTVKPRAEIHMDYDVGKSLQPGEQLDLELRFRTEQVVDELSIDIRSPEVQLSFGHQSNFRFAGSRRAAIVLPVVATKEGRFELHIDAIYTLNGQRQARSFAIPLTVGDNPAQKTTEESRSSSGYKTVPAQGVISMPAVETTE